MCGPIITSQALVRALLCVSRGRRIHELLTIRVMFIVLLPRSVTFLCYKFH